jgi:hypothetical protein
MFSWPNSGGWGQSDRNAVLILKTALNCIKAKVKSKLIPNSLFETFQNRASFSCSKRLNTKKQQRYYHFAAAAAAARME